MTSTTALTIRRATGDDQQEILSLLAASLGGGPTGARSGLFFRWKHGRNPFGSSLMLVAEAEGRIVGLRAFMRWRFRAGDHVLRAVRAVDTATHPDFQGRGIFTRLTLAALEELRGDTDLVFNTPNEKSLPGYLKMGWGIVGRVPIFVRVRRPIRFVQGLDALRDDAEASAPRPIGTPAGDGLAGLGDEAFRTAADRRIQTDADAEYYRWRYQDAPPDLGYRSLEVDRVVALFRVRPRGHLVEATVADVVGPSRLVAARSRALRRVGGITGVDHLTCSFPSGTANAVARRRAMFVRAPRGLTLTARPLRDDLPVDVTQLGNWAPVLGDLEVF